MEHEWLDDDASGDDETDDERVVCATRAQAESTDLVTPLRAYVASTLSEGDAVACGDDFGEAQRLRDGAAARAEDAGSSSGSWADAREALREYYRGLCAIESRIPISSASEHARVEFSWRDAGRGPRASPKAVAVPNVQYEKCAVLYNYAVTFSREGAKFGSDEGDAEGVKRAAAAFQSAAGAFAFLADVSERKLGGGGEMPSADLGREYCDVMIKLHLAQAQECFYLKAKAMSSSGSVVCKLAEQARSYYDEAERASSKLIGYVDDALVNYVKLKRAYLSAIAFRLSANVILAVDETDVGPAIARLRQAKDALSMAIKQSAVVSSDSGLERVKHLLNEEITPELANLEEDNECVYMTRVPKAEDLPALTGTSLVKTVAPPAEHFSPVGMTLFSSIVPDSGAKALSRYTEMVDELTRNETDLLAVASDEARLALREMELPETLVALSTPAPLGGDLEERVAAFRSSGGARALTASLNRVDELSRQCASTVKMIREILETEAAEDSAARTVHGEGAWRRESSSVKNREMMQALKRFEVDLEIATKSDEQLKSRVEGADGVLEQLTEENMKINAPLLTQPLALIEEDASVAVNIQATLEEIEKIGNERAGIEDLMRKTKAEDNILAKLMARVGESLDALFEEEIRKYDEVKEAVMMNISRQSDALSRLRSLQEKFVQIYDIEGLRRETQSHEHNIRHALSVVEDLRGGMEQGMRFYTGFLEAARRTLADVQDYASARRMEKEALGEELRAEKARAEQMAMRMSQMNVSQQAYYHASPPPQYAYPSPQYGQPSAPPPPPPPPPHYNSGPQYRSGY